MPESWRAPSIAGELWGLFWERFEELGGRSIDRAGLAAFPGRRWSVDPGVDVPAEAGPFEPAGPWEADLGITAALVAVAESGSLLVTGGRRLGSLAPPVHVATVPRAAIVGTLDEAIERTGHQTSVLVTGPSRTADIEGVLVRGVHGPREVFVLVTD
ncbi:MAG: lactate utilization protein [Armatimonadetes bacterium]|nr:lactate utilization protein [Armatimonadota bacterium]